MIDPNELSDEVLYALEQCFDCPTSGELLLRLRLMTPREVMQAFLEWHGFIGYTDLICDAYESIKSAERKPS